MGNVCSDPNSISKRSTASRINGPPTKRFTPDSSIKFEMLTWKNQILPDLRNEQNASKSEYSFNRSGQLIYSQKKDNLQFVPKQPQNNQVSSLETDFSYSKNPKNVLSMNIDKGSKCYQLTFANQFIYELINQQRQIHQGDRILIGGTQYKFVKLIRDPKYGHNKVKKMSEIKDPNIVQTNDYLKTFSHLPDQNPTCRICLSQQISKEDPLICPCNCTGSVKYFHLKCWSSWSFSSQRSQQGLYIGNVIKQQCQLCKKNLLDNQHYRQTVAALLSSAAKIKTPFIVLQGLKPLENYPYYRSIKLNYLILSFAEKRNYTIGRGQVDIPLEIDSSISRKNTSIEFIKDKVFIQDVGSKHGTYIRVNPPVVVKDDRPKYYLYNNHLFNVKIA